VITTHVLDTAAGRPGSGIAIELEHDTAGVWTLVGGGITDDDGRLRTLTPHGAVAPGTYRIRFHTGAYFTSQGSTGFFPVIDDNAAPVFWRWSSSSCMSLGT